MGYGTQEAHNGPGGQTHPGGGVRMKASLDFNALNTSWVHLSMIKARDLGADYYDTHTIDPACKAARLTEQLHALGYRVTLEHVA